MKPPQALHGSLPRPSRRRGTLPRLLVTRLERPPDDFFRCLDSHIMSGDTCAYPADHRHRSCLPACLAGDSDTRRARATRAERKIGPIGQNGSKLAHLRRRKVKTPFEGLRGAQESKPVKFVGRQNPRGRPIAPFALSLDHGRTRVLAVLCLHYGEREQVAFRSAIY